MGKHAYVGVKALLDSESIAHSQTWPVSETKRVSVPRPAQSDRMSPGDELRNHFGGMKLDKTEQRGRGEVYLVGWAKCSAHRTSRGPCKCPSTRIVPTKLNQLFRCSFCCTVTISKGVRPRAIAQ